MIKKILLAVTLTISLSLTFPCLACTLTLGRFAINPSDALQKWAQSPLRAAMNKATGCDVIYKPFASTQQLQQAAIHHQVDLAFLKDFNYYMVKKNDPEIKPLAVALSYRLQDKKLSPYYTGYLLSLITNKNIQSIADLAGKKIGFLSPYSTSGFVIPFMFFHDKKINYSTYFSQITFYDGHDDNLYQALLNGKVDVIATWDDVVIRNKVGPIRILKSFTDIPNPAFVVINPISNEKFKALQEAIIKVPYKMNVKYPAQGYVLPQSGMYDSLFKMFDRFCEIKPDVCR